MSTGKPMRFHCYSAYTQTRIKYSFLFSFLFFVFCLVITIKLKHKLFDIPKKKYELTRYKHILMSYVYVY